MEQNIGLVLAKRAHLNPDLEAYVDDAPGAERERLTFAQLAERSNRVARALAADGVAPGDRVALLLHNGAEFIETFFAAARLGAVVVPLNWRLVADELAFILEDSGARLLVYDEDFVDTVTALHERGDALGVGRWIEVGTSAPASFAERHDAWRDAQPAEPLPVGASGDDLLYIMYTSGTTGRPKGVMHSHATAMWGVLTIAATADLRHGDRYLAALPMFHVGALTPLTLCIYRGATSLVMRTFDARRAWSLIEEERATTGLAVPAMLNFMSQVPGCESFEHGELRWCMSGAAPMPVPLIERYAELGIEILQVYGLTESCGPACLIDSAHAISKRGSTGKAFFHTEVRIVDESGRECPPGSAGEVHVRGPHVMLGYWNRPDATAESLVDGWLRTGDGATMDEERFVYIQDRLKDMIISGGENVYPAEIEEVLMGHPGIAEAAVIGRPSERWGESPFAIVVRASDELDEAEVLRWCDGRLARYKLPKGVAFVDEIPRNPSGKILKRELRDRYPDPIS